MVILYLLSHLQSSQAYRARSCPRPCCGRSQCRHQSQGDRLTHDRYTRTVDTWGIPTDQQDIRYTACRCQARCIYIARSQRHTGCHGNHVSHTHKLRVREKREFTCESFINAHAQACTATTVYLRVQPFSPNL